jgi:hypothetical protein
LDALLPIYGLSQEGFQALVHLAVILQDLLLRPVGGLSLPRFVQGVSLAHPVVELARTCRGVSGRRCSDTSLLPYFLTSLLEQAQLVTCLLNFSLASRMPCRVKGEQSESAGLKTLDPRRWLIQ